jgi:hypothetical protein
MLQFDPGYRAKAGKVPSVLSCVRVDVAGADDAGGLADEGLIRAADGQLVEFFRPHARLDGGVGGVDDRRLAGDRHRDFLRRQLQRHWHRGGPFGLDEVIRQYDFFEAAQCDLNRVAAKRHHREVVTAHRVAHRGPAETPLFAPQRHRRAGQHCPARVTNFPGNLADLRGLGAGRRAKRRQHQQQADTGSKPCSHSVLPSFSRVASPAAQPGPAEALQYFVPQIVTRPRTTSQW